MNVSAKEIARAPIRALNKILNLLRNKPVDFSDTLPQTAKLSHVGLLITYEDGGVLKVPPGAAHDLGSIPIRPGFGAVVEPYLPGKQEVLERLVHRQWMVSAGKKTHIKHILNRNQTSLDVFSALAKGETPSESGKELFVCFEAIDVTTNCTYQVELSFTHM